MINAQSSGPLESSLDGKFIWDKTRGQLKTDTTAIAVTPSSEGGEPGDIQRAIDVLASEAGGIVLLRNGTYLMDADITIPSDITLQGETEGAAIIDFQSQAFQIKAVGSNPYTTGTVTATNNSTTVTGSGTAWTDAMIGRTIWLKGLPYVITARASATSLTIEAGFEEGTASGLAYAIADPITNVLIDSLTVQNSTDADGAIKFQYVNGSRIRDVSAFDSTKGFYFNFCNGCRVTGFTVIGNGTGVDVNNAGAWTFNDFFLYASTGTGMVLNRMISCEIANFTASSNGANSFTFTNSSDIGLFDATIITNTGKGIEISDSTDIEIFAVTSKFNGSDGIKLTSNANRIGMNNISLITNTGYGINIAAATCDKNTITGCFFTGNVAGTILNAGTGTITANNQT